jgi:hypothetical protein
MLTCWPGSDRRPHPPTKDRAAGMTIVPTQMRLRSQAARMDAPALSTP